MQKIREFVDYIAPPPEDVPAPEIPASGEEIPRIPVLDNCEHMNVDVIETGSLKRTCCSTRYEEQIDQDVSIRFAACDSDRKSTKVLFADYMPARGQSALILRSVTAPMRDYLTIGVLESPENIIKGYIHTGRVELCRLDGDLNVGVLTMSSEILSKEVCFVVTANTTFKQKLQRYTGLAFSKYVFEVKQENQTGPVIATIYGKTSFPTGKNYFQIVYSKLIDKTLKPLAICVTLMLTLKYAYPELLDVMRNHLHSKHTLTYGSVK